jgi:hypothetical protein
MASRKTHHHAPQIPVDPGAPRGERMVVMMVASHDVKQDTLKGWTDQKSDHIHQRKKKG